MKIFRWIRLLPLALFALAAVQSISGDLPPLPEDRGTAGTLAALEKLPVYVKVLETTAHPDDESAGTLTWLSRGYHATTALFCLTRGEGGQNILGNEKYAALGLVRTGELLEACRFYGADLFFGNNLDFGFSKTAEETFSKWGHDDALEEMVRFIRRWRPAIVLSRFRGDSSDGHGHHQAAGILTKEAFNAAADPQRFPGHFDKGLQPWRTKRLYTSARSAAPAGSGTAVVRTPIGAYNPVLGRAYREIASEGYSRHRTQGAGMSFSPPGEAYEYFEPSIPGTVDSAENGFFSGMDTSLMAICDLAGDEKGAVPFLKQNMSELMETARAALAAFRPTQPEGSAGALAEGIRILDASLRSVEAASLSRPAKNLLKDALREKRTDFEKAVASVLGIAVAAGTESMTAVPGEEVPVTVDFYNRGNETVGLARIDIAAPGTVRASDAASLPAGLPPGSRATRHFQVTVSRNAKISEPFWRLRNIRDARYEILDAADDFSPFTRPAFTVRVSFTCGGVEIAVDEPVKAQNGSPATGPDFEDIQVVPALSVALEPDFMIAPAAAAAGEHPFLISVKNDSNGEIKGTVKLVSDGEWPAQPAEGAFALSRKGEIHTATITIRIPDGTAAGTYLVRAVATMDGHEFALGQQKIAYPGNRTRFLYEPAKSEIKIFDLKTIPGLSVGYVPGAGDDIPEALERMNVRVRILTASDLSSGDLDRFDAVVTGIRAYNINEDLKAYNRRLLDYVARGGVLIVEYVRPEGPGPGSAFQYGPFPMRVSNSDRITVEDSPLRILAPEHRVFNWPNKITQADFDGWVQERGLYFMNSWDDRYTPLLEGNDPGEKPQRGGMLITSYGKGWYVYSAYSWFRQLPAGVAGAYRIFANMISLGSPKEQSTAETERAQRDAE